ncbi:hypothetical protein [Rheinheimera sp.]|uniref:hypothetical protein n=1 Tax=Rheinheimera sp. TaxID=1869214 RepID=UPI00307CEF4F
MNFKLAFHYLSYLQYPLMLSALYCAFSPYLAGFSTLKANPSLIFESLNTALIFMGLGLSFSSLQDTSKMQNKFSQNIWQNPAKGKLAIGLMCGMILLFLLMGLAGYFFSSQGILKDLSVGTIVLALGMFGFLKAALEIFEQHRLDKKPDTNSL